MKLLNDRLAKYLEKVSRLEEENSRLERNIQEWNEKNAQKEQPNYNNYFLIVQELKNKVRNICRRKLIKEDEFALEMSGFG